MGSLGIDVPRQVGIEVGRVANQELGAAGAAAGRRTLSGEQEPDLPRRLAVVEEDSCGARRLRFCTLFERADNSLDLRGQLVCIPRDETEPEAAAQPAPAKRRGQIAKLAARQLGERGRSTRSRVSSCSAVAAANGNISASRCDWIRRRSRLVNSIRRDDRFSGSSTVT